VDDFQGVSFRGFVWYCNVIAAVGACVVQCAEEGKVEGKGESNRRNEQDE
jgi:hypothetical protein